MAGGGCLYLLTHMYHPRRYMAGGGDGDDDEEEDGGDDSMSLEDIDQRLEDLFGAPYE